MKSLRVGVTRFQLRRFARYQVQVPVPGYQVQVPVNFLLFIVQLICNSIRLTRVIPFGLHGVLLFFRLIQHCLNYITASLFNYTTTESRAFELYDHGVPHSFELSLDNWTATNHRFGLHR